MAVVPDDLSVERVEVWFQDEARVGQRGTVTRIWAPKGVLAPLALLRMFRPNRDPDQTQSGQ